MIASADKTIKVFNAESLEVVASLEAVHKMSITDVTLVSPGLVATTSSDQRVLTHKIDLEAKSIETVGEFSLQEADAAGITDKADKQQLAIAAYNGQLFSSGNISDISVWDANSAGPATSIIRGHKNTVTAILVDGNHMLTGDIDGRILSWDLDSGKAQRPQTFYKHELEVSAFLKVGEKFYSFGGDKRLVPFKMGPAPDGQGECLFAEEPFKHEALDKKYAAITTNGTDMICHLSQDAELNIFTVGDSVQHTKTVSLKEQGANDVAVVGETFFLLDNGGGAYTLTGPDFAVTPIEGVKTHYGNKGVRIAATENGRLAIGDEKGFVTVCEGGAELAYFSVGKKPLQKVGFTAYGGHVFSLGSDRALSLGDLNDKKTLKTVVAPSDYAQPTTAALVGERQIAVAGDDGAVRVWKY